jgi:hypothetical protein
MKKFVLGFDIGNDIAICVEGGERISDMDEPINLCCRPAGNAGTLDGKRAASVGATRSEIAAVSLAFIDIV